jgi:CheY-like chemotaxis protein
MSVDRSQTPTALRRVAKEAAKWASHPSLQPRKRAADGACRARRGAAPGPFARSRTARAAGVEQRLLEDAKSTVLVCEDDVLLALHLQQVLTDAGHEPLWAADAHEAAFLLDSHAHSLSALLTDIDLGPGPSGFEVAHLARHRRPALPVIYVTAQPEAEVRRRGVNGSVLIAKPFDPDHLLTVLLSLIGPVVACLAMGA